MTEQEFAEEVRSFSHVVKDMSKAKVSDLEEHGRLSGIIRACVEYAEAVDEGDDPVERLRLVEDMFRKHRELSEFFVGLTEMTEVLIRLHDKVVDTE